MARILGGIASSHTPTIGFALDAQKQGDPVWARARPLQEFQQTRNAPGALYSVAGTGS